MLTYLPGYFDYLDLAEARANTVSEMTRKRFVAPGYTVNTKGHSVLKRYSYGGRASSPVDDLYYESYRPRHTIYDTTGEENEIRRSVNRELMLSNHAVDDTFDLATKSRNRDQSLLRDATNAIPPSNSKPANRVSSAGRMVSSTSSTPRRFLSGSMYNRSINVQPLGSISNAEWSNTSTMSDRFRDHRYAESYRPRRIVPRESPIRSPTLSPYQSPRESPDRDLGQRYQSWRRRKPRLPVSAARETLGNYYKRLIHKRAERPQKGSSVTLPYYETNSLQSSDVESFCSDDENDREKYMNYPIPAPTNTYGVIDDDYDDAASGITTYSVGSNSYTIMSRERSPSPVEYMAYQPKRAVSVDSESFEDRYKTAVPDMPDFTSLSPIRPSSSGSSVSDDVNFYNIVAQTAAKARKALSSVNLDEYESASLVLSVEGEYKDPVKGNALGFQYIARPLPLKGPMLAGPASYAAGSTDSIFGRYLSDLSDFRQSIRQRLESGYQALRDATRVSRYQSLSPSRSYGDYLSRYTGSSLRKRLEEGGDCITLYPLQGNTRALTSPDALSGHPDVMDLYESGKDLQLSTLDKIKIKVNSEIHASPKAAVASRRARMYHQPTVVPWSYNLQSKTTTTTTTPSQSYVRSPRREVALLSTIRQRPASAYWDSDLESRLRVRRAMAGWGGLPTWSHLTDVEGRLPYGPFLTETLYGPKVFSYYHRYEPRYYNYWSAYPYFYLSKYRGDRPAVRVLANPLVHKRKLAKRKAALVGSKVDVVLPKRRGRAPKSEYAANAMRRIRKEAREKESISPESTTHLTASKPVPTPRGGTPLSDDLGLPEPTSNILSWQYRLESRVPPENLLYQPKAYATVRDQIRQVQDKMDRHKQLMDRYLETDLDKPESESVQTKIMNMYVDMESRNPSLYRRSGAATSSDSQTSEISTNVSVRAPSVYRPPPRRTQSEPPQDYKPMSDVRRRVRRVICKNRRDPTYYKQ